MKNPKITSYSIGKNGKLSPKMRNRAKISTFATSIHVILEILDKASITE